MASTTDIYLSNLWVDVYGHVSSTSSKLPCRGSFTYPFLYICTCLIEMSSTSSKLPCRGSFTYPFLYICTCLIEMSCQEHMKPLRKLWSLVDTIHVFVWDNNIPLTAIVVKPLLHFVSFCLVLSEFLDWISLFPIHWYVLRFEIS